MRDNITSFLQKLGLNWN